MPRPTKEQIQNQTLPVKSRQELMSLLGFEKISDFSHFLFSVGLDPWKDVFVFSEQEKIKNYWSKTLKEAETNKSYWSLIRTKDDEYIVGNTTRQSNTEILMSSAFFVLCDGFLSQENVTFLVNTGLLEETMFSSTVETIIVTDFKWLIKLKPEAIKLIQEFLEEDVEHL